MTTRAFKYSLLVPCFNAEKYIDQFLENIAQLVPPFDEIIFYDDASSDNTAAILLSKGFRVIKGDINKGPGYARNQLAKSASFEWFHFHDIDDCLSPHYLSSVTHIAEKDGYDVILCNVDWYVPGSKNLVSKWMYSNEEINKDPVIYTIAHPIGGINGLYRKNKFLESGGFNSGIRLWEDADLHVRLAAKKARFFVVEEMLSYSFRYSGSASVDQKIGWVIRLNLLLDYLNLFDDDKTRTEIGKQAQAAASGLIIAGQFTEAKSAFLLSEKCKVKVPFNNSKIWNFIKSFTPPFIRIELRLIQLRLAFNKAYVK